MQDKLDPEQLGIITLNSFMEEFFPSHNSSDAVQHTFNIFHFNGLKCSCPNNKVSVKSWCVTYTAVSIYQSMNNKVAPP